jgi:hypothetical protein
MEEALQFRRRAQIAERFISGEWGVELDSFEANREIEPGDAWPASISLWQR